MVWPFHRGNGGTSSGSTEVDEANKAIASIFSPSHAALHPTASESARADAASAGEAPIGVPGRRAPQQSQRFSLKKGKKGSEPLSEASATAASPAAVGREPALTVEVLPPCPIAGYSLDPQRGIVDHLTEPPHALSTQEVRRMIVELAGLEQNARYAVDTAFPSQMGARSLRALELLVNPCLLLTGTYLMTYKTAQLYSGALPRQSFILRHFAAVFASVAASPWPGKGAPSVRMTAEHKEQLAQRHQRLMRATNARVALTFATGLLLFAVAVVTRPATNVVEDNPEVRLGKQMVGYQQHSEASLKWLWFVYYHHPAYSKEAKSFLAPPSYHSSA